MAQTFWLLDAETRQPVCFTTATAARSVAKATPDLLELAGEILGPQTQPALVLADMEHYSAELLDHVANSTEFEILVPKRSFISCGRGWRHHSVNGTPSIWPSTSSKAWTVTSVSPRTRSSSPIIQRSQQRFSCVAITKGCRRNSVRKESRLESLGSTASSSTFVSAKRASISPAAKSQINRGLKIAVRKGGNDTRRCLVDSCPSSRVRRPRECRVRDRTQYTHTVSLPIREAELRHGAFPSGAWERGF